MDELEDYLNSDGSNQVSSIPKASKKIMSQTLTKTNIMSQPFFNKRKTMIETNKVASRNHAKISPELNEK